MYWGVILLAGLLLYDVTRQLSLPNRPLGWRIAWAVLAIIPILAIVQSATRIFAPHSIQCFTDRLSTRQRFALYCLHSLAIIIFFVVGIARLCVDIVPGIGSHRGFLPWLWINSIVLVICIADLSGTTANIWRPQKAGGPHLTTQKSGCPMPRF
jgi:hypothetical protein